MRKLISILFFSWIISSCIIEDNTGADIKAGDSLPEFEVTMNDGTVVNRSSLTEKVSVLMFFHPSCPDCRQALPLMQDIYDEYALNDVNFALISRECGDDEIRAFWEENRLDMPYSAQNDRGIYNLFAASRIPRIYISDENGTVRYIFTDDPVASYDDLKSALESLIR